MMIDKKHMKSFNLSSSLDCVEENPNAPVAPATSPVYDTGVQPGVSSQFSDQIIPNTDAMVTVNIR